MRDFKKALCLLLSLCIMLLYCPVAAFAAVDTGLCEEGHSWDDPTCTAFKTCSVCSVTEDGKAHVWSDDVCSVCGSVTVSSNTFPDSAFCSYVSSELDSDGDGCLTVGELAAVTSMSAGNKGIYSLAGIEYFTDLQQLYCQGNYLYSLDLSKNTALTVLSCGDNRLSQLNISGNTALTDVKCSNNSLTELDVSKNTALENLICNGNEITELDVSENAALTQLLCYDNCITELDLSNNPALTKLQCQNNQLEVLNVSENTMLQYLQCSDNSLTELDVSNNVALTTLYCQNNKLTELYTAQNTALAALSCSGNLLTDLSLSTNTGLSSLTCSNNQLTSLDISSNTSLRTFTCTGNNRTVTVNNNQFDLSLLPDFDLNKATAWSGGTVDGTILTVSSDTVTYTYDVGGDRTAAFSLTVETCDHNWEAATCTNPKTCSLCGKKEGGTDASNHSLAGDICSECGIVKLSEITFPDACFLCYVCDVIDTNGDGYLTAEERAAVLDISLPGQGITDLTGIEHFTALQTLNCENNALTRIDLSKNTALTELNCADNDLTKLDISQNGALIYVNCSGNRLTELDVSNNTELETLECTNNNLTITIESDQFDLNELPGFDVSRASDWVGGTIDGTVLTATENVVTYTYDMGNNFSEIFTLTLEFTTEPEPTAPETTQATEPTESTEPAGPTDGSVREWNVELSDEIGLNFYMNVEETDEVTACIGQTQISAEYSGGVLSVGLPAAQMNDEVTILVNGEPLEKTYSVRTYANEIMAGDYSDDTKNLVKHMLNYGAAAQDAFGYNEENPANEGVEVELPDVPGIEPVEIAGISEGVVFHSASLVCVEKIAVRFYFSADAAFTANGVSQTAVAKDGLYYVEVGQIEPQDLDAEITVVANGSLTVTYSPMDYIRRMYHKTDSAQTMKSLVQALYGYHLAAKVYVVSNA